MEMVLPPLRLGLGELVDLRGGGVVPLGTGNEEEGEEEGEGEGDVEVEVRVESIDGAEGEDARGSEEVLASS